MTMILTIDQLATNFISFAEKLASTITSIAVRLPQYDALTSSSVGLSPRMKASITNIYVDLFRFFQGVVGVFTKKDGSKSKVNFMRM